MPRLQDTRIVDPVLTELLIGYSNEEFVGTSLFPIVNVNKEAGKIPTFGKEAFKVYSTLRALRAQSNRLPVEARGTIDFVLDEHDAVYPVDYREVDEDSFEARAYGAYRAESAILLKNEYSCAMLATDLNNYPTNNKATLSGTSQWTDKANSKPIDDVKGAVSAVRNAIAKEPNTMLIGYDSFQALTEHPTILERIKYSQIGVVTIDLLKAIFNIPNIVVGKGVYVDDEDVQHDLWGGDVVLSYVAPKRSDVPRSIYEPTYGYTLRKTGMPEADTYREEGGKIENIRSTDLLQVKIVGSDAGFLIKNAA